MCPGCLKLSFYLAKRVSDFQIGLFAAVSPSSLLLDLLIVLYPELIAFILPNVNPSLAARTTNTSLFIFSTSSTQEDMLLSWN